MRKFLFCAFFSLVLMLLASGTARGAEGVLPGDANGDGVINHLDAMLIAQYYVGAIGGDSIIPDVSDVNEDGQINHLDAMLAAQIYVGAANVHSHSYQAELTAAPTCTADGLKTYTCSCGHSYTEAIPALGHNYTKVVTAPTCTAQGYTTYTCSSCNDSYKDDYTNAIDHDYTSQVTKSPTCTESGVRTYTCTMCGNKYTETISATGHQNTKSETVDGYVVVACVDCGAEVSKTPVSSGGTCVLCGSARVTKNLAEAVAADIAAGYRDFQRYANFFDWNVQVCGSCGWIEESTIELAYSDYEACEIMLGYVNELRREVYGGTYYDLEIDQTLLELAKIRAEEIYYDFTHYGGTYTHANENITSVGPNIITQFEAWKASEGHYENMIDGYSKFFGYAVFWKPKSSCVTGVQLFWDETQRQQYIGLPD